MGDNLMLDEAKAGSGWVDQVMARKEEEEDEEDEDEDDEEDDEEEEDGEEEEEEDGDEEWEQSGSEEEGKAEEGKAEERKVGVVKEVKGGGAGGELPFVISAPQSLAEWRAVVDGRGLEEVAEAIRRVRLCNAVALHPSNKRNMQIFYAVLLHYFSFLAGELPLPMERLDALLPPLLDLAASTPLYAALCARERLVAMHRQLARKLKEGEAEGVSCWPSVRVLFLFRLWALTFPPSDFRHPVITPLLLVGGEYLAVCRVRSLKDAAMGLFLCSLLLAMVREGRRLLPEALCFLQHLLDSAAPPPPQGGGKEKVRPPVAPRGYCRFSMRPPCDRCCFHLGGCSTWLHRWGARSGCTQPRRAGSWRGEARWRPSTWKQWWLRTPRTLSSTRMRAGREERFPETA